MLNALTTFDVGGIWMEFLPMFTLDKGISYVSGLVSAVDETLSVNEVKEEGGNDILYDILYIIKILLKYY